MKTREYALKAKLNKVNVERDTKFPNDNTNMTTTITKKTDPPRYAQLGSLVGVVIKLTRTRK